MVASFGLLLLALFAVSTFFSLLWLLYRQKGNAGIVDIGWGVSFLLIGLLYFWLGDGKYSRKLLLLFMILLWAGRLTLHLIQRFSVDKEDPRYTSIISGWKGHVEEKVYGMFLGQGALAVLLSLPFLLIFENRVPHLRFIEGVGVAVWLVGFVGESWADYQLAQFKKEPENSGKVCQVGFWSYSRHPNYFFEWVVWVGFGLFALGAPHGWFGLISPILMFFLLVYGSGIPFAEQQALKTKGDGYRDYMKTTSPFFPWFKKRG